MMSPAVDVTPARTTAASVLLALVLACQAAPRADDRPDRQPRAATESAQGRSADSSERPPPKVCSPSTAGPVGTFEALIAGDRFALLLHRSSRSVLDLDRAALVHLEGAIEAVACGPHCVAYRPLAEGLQLGLAPRASQLRLRNLLTGHEESFEGELVEDAQLPPGLVALREATSLGLLDARSRTWLARVTTKWPATSVAVSADGRSLYVLSLDPARDRHHKHNYDAWLELFRVPHDDSAERSHRHRYTSAKLGDLTQFDGAMVKTSEPRVYRLDSGALVVGHITGCKRCAGRTPEAHLFRVVHPETGEPTGEAGFRYQDDLAPGGIEARLWPAEQDRAVLAPARVQRVLDALQCR